MFQILGLGSRGANRGVTPRDLAIMQNLLMPGEDGVTRTSSETGFGPNTKVFHSLVVGDTVCARIARTGIKQVTADLISRESISGEMIDIYPGFKGTIRATDIPQIKEFLHILFKPGSHFKARIIGVGEVSSGFILVPLFE